MLVKELSDINLLSLNKNSDIKKYKYLDTGNITDNIVDEIKIYDNASDLPSRAKRLVSPGDIIISTVRPNQRHYGYIDESRSDLIVSTGFAVLTPKKELVNSLYLYYFLTQSKIVNHLQKISESGVSSYPSIKPEVIEDLEINLPDSIEEQIEIANEINLFDSKINLNNKLIDELDEVTQLLYYKWFVLFEFEESTGVKYEECEVSIKDDIQMPEGWELKCLNELVEIKTNSVVPSNNPDKKYKYYSIPAFDDIKTYSEECGKTILSNKYAVSSNNILVSKLNPWFKRIVYPLGIDEAICSTEFVVWKPLKNQYLEYLYIIANSNKFINYCTQSASGTSTSHKRVNPEHMMMYKVPYNEEVVKRFNDIVEPMVKKKNLLLLENKELREMRDLLIKKLIK